MFSSRCCSPTPMQRWGWACSGSGSYTWTGGPRGYPGCPTVAVATPGQADPEGTPAVLLGRGPGRRDNACSVRLRPAESRVWIVHPESPEQSVRDFLIV